MHETPESAVPEIPGNEQAVEPAQDKPVKKHKAKKAATAFEPGESGFLSKAQRAKIVLVTDESDLLYNPKVKDPPPAGFDKSLAKGWHETNPLTILPDGRIFSGRTKWRVLEKAEKIAGREIPVPYKVLSMTEDEAAGATDQLDLMVQRVNPMVIAEKIARHLMRGRTEKEFHELNGVTPADQNAFLSLMDEKLCPPHVQELIRSGQMPLTAAFELIRRAEKMTEGEIKKAADEIAKVAAGGVRLTAEQVKKAAGVKEGKPATLREKKVAILSLDSAGFKGKHADAVKWAAMVALEYGIGTRTEDSFWGALKKIAQGGTVKVEFKQYHSAADHREKDE